MAILRMGHVVGAISGNLGAVNFAQGHNGPYVRRRMRRTDKSAERQLEVRVRIQRLKNLWMELSEEKKELWRATARGVRRLNRLGIATGISGHTFYIKTNLWVITAGYAVQDEPPGALQTPPPWNVEFTVTLPNTYEIAWQGDVQLEPYLLFIFSARPIVGHAVRPIKHWRFTEHTIDPGTPFDIKFDFVEQWGAPAAGEYVAIKLYLLSDLRLRSLPVEAGCIVT